MKVEVMDGLGAIGVVYSSSPYWRRRDGRPMLSVSLYAWKLIIFLPWRHVTEKGRGTATSIYGVFWWPKLSLKPQIHCTSLPSTKENGS